MGLSAGKKFKSPGGKGGYKLTKDLNFGDAISCDLFKPYGGQPVPEKNMPMPTWLTIGLQIEAHKLMQRTPYEGVEEPPTIGGHNG